MKKVYLSVLSAFMFLIVNATNYYVDAVNGSNSNTGLSPAQAFQAIQNAANNTNPGDTVFIMNGIYTTTGTILNIARSGDATRQIVYTNYPGHLPKVKASITTYNIINIAPGISYITVNGLEVEGWGVNMSLAADTIPAQAQQSCPVSGSPSTGQNPVNKYNQNGITGDSRSLGSTGSHHIVISNNIVHDCGGGGIALIQCDYITYDGNTVYNNSWYNIYGTSGMSVNNYFNFDNNTAGYRNIIRNNVAYNNRLYVPWRSVCQITDGNGIILDVPLTGYTGRTLVFNNIVFNNGGSGIHSFKNNHSDIIHNTAYYNSQSPAINSGEIYARGADDIKIYNNILVSAPGEIVSGTYSSTNLSYDYNLYFGGSSVDMVGMHSLIQNPQFINPSTNPAVANFHLQAGSAAINNGDNTNSTAADKDGTGRPIRTIVDIGAYESSFVGAFNSSGTQQTKVLGNASGGGTGEPGAGSYNGPYDTRIGNANQKSRRAIVYPQALLSSIPANSIINSLQFNRAIQSGNTQVVPDNSIVKIYLRNEAADNFGSATFDWTSVLPGAANPAVLVYGGEASPLAGNAGGWKTVPFQAPFTYTGGHLGVFIEYLQKASIASAPDILWVYDNGGSQPLYNTTTYPNQLYATKTTSTTGVISDNLTTNNERRPVITVGYYTPTILPVTLIRFTAVKKGSSVDVNWIVATELNNAGFDVQRSADGIHFQSIAWVASKAADGNSSSPTQYNYTDASPVNGSAYYRLQQKDRDGKLTYSPIAIVRAAVAGISFVTMYPVPANDKMHFIVNREAASSVAAVISIQNTSGQVVSKFQTTIAAGYNNIEIDLTKHPASAYLLVIELASGEKITEKFIKM